MFALKSLMKVYPSFVLLTSLLTSIFLFAYVIRIAERPVPDPIFDLSYYMNTLWLSLITVFTSII